MFRQVVNTEVTQRDFWSRDLIPHDVCSFFFLEVNSLTFAKRVTVSFHKYRTLWWPVRAQTQNTLNTWTVMDGCTVQMSSVVNKR